MGATNSEKIKAMTDLLREHGGVMPRSEFVGKLMAANMGKSSTLYAFIKSPKAKAFGIHTSGEGQSAIVSLTENPTGINAGSTDNVLGSAELDNLVLGKVKALRDAYIKIGRGDANRFNANVLESVNQVPSIEQWRESLAVIEKMSKIEQQMMFLRIALTTIKE